MLAVHDTAAEPIDPEACQRVGLPAGESGKLELAVVERPGAPAVVRPVPVRLLGLAEALPALLRISSAPTNAFRRPSDSLRAWAVAARLAVRVVAADNLAPALHLAEDGIVTGVWRALLDDDEEAAAALAQLAAWMPPSGHCLALDERHVWDPEALTRAFVDAVADLSVRSGGPPPRGSRPRARLLPWTARWAEALADSGDPTVPLRDDAAEVVAGVTGWLAAPDVAGGTTQVRLVEPEADDGPWRVELGLRDDSGVLLAAEEVWSADPDEPDTLALQEALLRGLARCARVYEPLERALQEADPSAVDVDGQEAWLFICEATPLLRGAGVVVVLPEGVSEDALRIRLRVGDDEGQDEDAADEIPLFEGVTDFTWEVAVGDEILEDWELEQLERSSSPLVRWRDRWLRIDPSEVARLRRLGRGGRMSMADGLTLSLAGTAGLSDILGEGHGTEQVEVVAGGRLAELVERIARTADPPPLEVEPPGFVGELRPYQRRGVAWLGGMAELGLGAVLADSMGLGKTIQLIGHLLLRGVDGTQRPVLVVCPTSVVGNWQRELERFAPSLPVTPWHGTDRPSDPAAAHGVVVTSYGTLRRDVSVLEQVHWSLVALDEAQQIKNPQTAGARAVRRLPRAHTVALTGTPLENRLSELWSLMDVTNPGLMGSRGRFASRFVVPIEKRHDRLASARLRRLVRPFVLRRDKTDPAVIADLPDKIERTVPCALTPEQAELYRAAVAEVFDAQGPASAMERRGRILALLTKLKQICNHPAHLLGEPGPLQGRSGKLAVAREIVGEVVNAGDQMLIFTQYVAMGRLLVSQLEHDLDVDVPFLHGGVAAAARDRIVASFQAGLDGGEAPPVLIVSLRAGGTGLNLTAATHVLHYDRWWNPAVEDQATDRAHRIGQTRTVEVHKLVTTGTVEERIDDLLQSKRALAESVVTPGEAWITELGDDDLRELVALSATAPVGEVDDEPATLGAGGAG